MKTRLSAMVIFVALMAVLAMGCPGDDETDINDVFSLSASRSAIPANGASFAVIEIEAPDRAETVSLKTDLGTFLPGGNSVEVNVKQLSKAQVLLMSCTQTGTAHIRGRVFNTYAAFTTVRFTETVPDELHFLAEGIPLSGPMGATPLTVSALALREGDSVSDYNWVAFEFGPIAGETACFFDGNSVEAPTLLGRASIEVSSNEVCAAEVNASVPGDAGDIFAPHPLYIYFLRP